MKLPPIFARIRLAKRLPPGIRPRRGEPKPTVPLHSDIPRDVDRRLRQLEQPWAYHIERALKFYLDQVERYYLENGWDISNPPKEEEEE